ncbi:uncharacterized protein LOC141938267 [Strix uralensis]|uniref:uncharacterized protein LOC141938267 n=1 Tax=Strix uralensis TaxID=36305 RepID=UPI003DA70591
MSGREGVFLSSAAAAAAILEAVLVGVGAAASSSSSSSSSSPHRPLRCRGASAGFGRAADGTQHPGEVRLEPAASWPPQHCRTVRFVNLVCRGTVDAVQGDWGVLQLLGHTEETRKGLSFPPGAGSPQIPHVATITANVLLLRAERDLLLANQHLNPEFFTDVLAGGLRCHHRHAENFGDLQLQRELELQGCGVVLCVQPS